MDAGFCQARVSTGAASEISCTTRRPERHQRLHCRNTRHETDDRSGSDPNSHHPGAQPMEIVVDLIAFVVELIWALLKFVQKLSRVYPPAAFYLTSVMLLPWLTSGKVAVEHQGAR
jgi:hypothetical protein